MFTNGVQVRTDKDGNICLNDLHKAAGSESSKTPYRWQEIDSTKAFINAACKFLNNARSVIIKSKRGKGGGTYAHKQVALEYAQYLSPELGVAVNQVFFERIEEEKNPELAVDRARKTWNKKGKSDAWVNQRLLTIAARNHFTATLAAHDVKGSGFKLCTNAIYMPMYGGGAEVVRQKKNLPVKTNTREHMSELELAGMRFAELMAAENIKAKNIRGNKPCEYECYASSQIVAQALVRNKSRQ